MNVVMTGAEQLVEIQGTGERGTFTESQMAQLFQSAKDGIRRLVAIQRESLKDILP